MQTFNPIKAVQLLNYFAIKEGESINCMKAYKLIWLSERYFLRNYGSLILNDNYYAMKNGPVASKVCDLLNKNTTVFNDFSYLDQYVLKFDRYNYKSLNDFNADYFSNKELNTFEKIYQLFGDYDEWSLSQLSHKFPEWAKFHKDLLVDKIKKRCEMKYEDFFISANFKSNIFEQSQEHIDFSKNYFLEYNSI